MSNTQGELEANLNWNALYIAANYFVCKIGAHGSADSDDNEVTNLMSALHKIDGGIVSDRAQELYEKAHMPIFDATRLAILECPSNFGHPHDHSLTEDGACVYCGFDEEAPTQVFDKEDGGDTARLNWLMQSDGDFFYNITKIISFEKIGFGAVGSDGLPADFRKLIDESMAAVAVVEKSKS